MMLAYNDLVPRKRLLQTSLYVPNSLHHIVFSRPFLLLELTHIQCDDFERSFEKTYNVPRGFVRGAMSGRRQVQTMKYFLQYGKCSSNMGEPNFVLARAPYNLGPS